MVFVSKPTQLILRQEIPKPKTIALSGREGVKIWTKANIKIIIEKNITLISQLFIITNFMQTKYIL